jgi:RNA-binding protein Musashi
MADYSGSPYEQPPSSPAGQPTTKIFVGGLPSSVTSEGLISHFSAYGEVVDATIMNDKITGRPRGFGFVTFRAPEAVDALMQEQHVLDGKQVECKRAVPMGYVDNKAPGGMPPSAAPMARPMPSGGAPPRYNPEKIFVGGLPISCDDNKLREYFSKYGVIVDAVVMVDRDLQRHRGFGYVLFQDAGAVDAAVAEHDNHQIDGKWVDVKRCVVQENQPTAAPGAWPQSGPMRKGYGKGGISSGMGMAPMPGVSATMPGYYGGPAAARPATGGYGGADYGTSQYYAPKPAGVAPGYGAPKPATTGYMTSAYGAQPTSAYGAQPASAYGYGVGPTDPYASSGYGAAAPSPYGAMPGYSTGYAGYGTSTGYGQTAPPPTSAYGYMPPTSAGAANPNDVYAASRRSGYRTSPY